MFITLEGSEGAGKSTLINLLKKYFSDKKLTSYLQENQGNQRGTGYRNILLDKTIELDPIQKHSLFWQIEMNISIRH